MKINLNSGFYNPVVKNLFKISQIDIEELKNSKELKFEEFLKVLIQNYKQFQLIVEKLNSESKTQFKLPEFDILKFRKTKKIPKELFNLFEYGNPFLGITPKKLMSKKKNL